MTSQSFIFLSVYIENLNQCQYMYLIISTANEEGIVMCIKLHTHTYPIQICHKSFIMSTSKQLYIQKYCMHRNIRLRLFFALFALAGSGQVQDWATFYVSNYFTSVIDNFVWANTRQGEIVCKLKRAKITQGENNPVYSNLISTQCMHVQMMTEYLICT